MKKALQHLFLVFLLSTGFSQASAQVQCPGFQPGEVTFNLDNGHISAPDLINVRVVNPIAGYWAGDGNGLVVIPMEYLEQSPYGSIIIEVRRICVVNVGGVKTYILSQPTIKDDGPLTVVPVGDDGGTLDYCNNPGALESFLYTHRDQRISVNLECLCAVVVNGLNHLCADNSEYDFCNFDLTGINLDELIEIYGELSEVGYNVNYLETHWGALVGEINEQQADNDLIEGSDLEAALEADPSMYWDTNFAYIDYQSNVANPEGNGLEHCTEWTSVPEFKTEASNTGLAELSSTVFPNPSTSDFRISLTTEVEGNYTINISDIAGHLIRTINVGVSGTAVINIPMSNEASGMYYYTIYNETDRLDQGKLIKL